MRRGISAGPLGLVQAAAFAGLMLAGTALLVVAAAPAVLTALGLGHLLQDLLRQSSSGVSRKDVIAAVTGLAGLPLLLLPAALLGTRWLATLTRRLVARWCGVIDRRGLSAGADRNSPSAGWTAPSSSATWGG